MAVGCCICIVTDDNCVKPKCQKYIFTRNANKSDGSPLIHLIEETAPCFKQIPIGVAFLTLIRIGMLQIRVYLTHNKQINVMDGPFLFLSDSMHTIKPNHTAQEKSFIYLL